MHDTDDTDEFLIDAGSRTWTRSSYNVAKFIADQAVFKLGHAEAKVYNIYGGVKSDPLYVVQRRQDVG